MPEGLQIALSAMPANLTVARNGRKLLQDPFVFQIPPLEEYQTARAYNHAMYDTINNGQFIRLGSRQSDTWSFDTLVMYLGVDRNGLSTPRWVPFPTAEKTGHQKRPPEWYVGQLTELLDSGAPFRYVAAFRNSTTVRRAWAVLTGFTEVHKFGEGDAIYLSGVGFAEWRDPGAATQPAPRGSHKLPASVAFRQIKTSLGKRIWVAFEFQGWQRGSSKHGKQIKGWGRQVPNRGERDSTLNDLARYFYGDASKWRWIALANNLRGGTGDSPIKNHWFPRRHKNYPLTLVIPKAKPATWRGVKGDVERVVKK